MLDNIYSIMLEVGFSRIDDRESGETFPLKSGIPHPSLYTSLLLLIRSICSLGFSSFSNNIFISTLIFSMWIFFIIGL